MSEHQGASSRPPEGRNNTPDPSWTPKEPNRPLRPKPGSFGVSKSFPLPNAEGVIITPKSEIPPLSPSEKRQFDIDMETYIQSLDPETRKRFVAGKWDDLSNEEPDGSPN